MTLDLTAELSQQHDDRGIVLRFPTESLADIRHYAKCYVEPLIDRMHECSMGNEVVNKCWVTLTMTRQDSAVKLAPAQGFWAQNANWRERFDEAVESMVQDRMEWVLGERERLKAELAALDEAGETDDD